MPSNVDVVRKCQTNMDSIRNICILAHVDHGKTTLMDFLCASNGIISTNIAGELRYMDSRDDEQERGITMKSSAISLLYSSNDLHLINLVDTPGHIDFSFEVAAAVRVCDGAIVVVDVVEGVCSQTFGVIRSALMEGLGCVLLLNKMDKLFTHLKFTVQQASLHLKKIVEQVNSIVAQHYISEDPDNKNITSYFVPESGNVVFGSSVDGWGFTIPQFAQIIAAKMPKISPKVISSHLWADYCWNTKKQTFLDCSDGHRSSLLEKHVLGSIWAVYEAAHQENHPQLDRICTSIGIIRHNRRKVLTAAELLSNWLELYRAIFDAVVGFVPPPSKLGEKRVERLLGVCGDDKTLQLGEKMVNPSCSESTVVAYVSKLIFIPPSDLPRHLQGSHANGFSQDQILCVGFARSFMGTINKGDKYFFLGPKHDHTSVGDDLPADYPHGESITIDDLFIFMGREMTRVDSVSPGNIFGFVPRGNIKFMKTATLSSCASCPALTPSYFDSHPIMTVSVEPEDIDDLGVLNRGLEMLHLSDPCVETHVSNLGEHLIKVSGQLHLEKCIEDLKHRFVRVPLTISRPIVQFRETLVSGSTAAEVISLSSPSSSLTCKINTFPLIPQLLGLLQNSGPNDALYDSLRPAMEQCSLDIRSVASLTGTNILLNRSDTELPNIWGTNINIDSGAKRFHSSMCNGFKLAMDSGPLCEESVYGVCCVIEEFGWRSDSGDCSDLLLLCPQLISSFRSACRNSMSQSEGLRLVEPMFMANIRAPSCHIGKVNGIIGRRGGRVVSEDVIDDSDIFVCDCHIPIVNSFGFEYDIRSKTRGMASAQMKFSHWEVVEDESSRMDQCVHEIRLRKGLDVHEQIVEDPNKQRTLAKKK